MSERRGAQAAPLRAPPSPLTAAMTCNDAFKALVQASLDHYSANVPGMLGADDPEYLHQMRVALRRMRSVFNTFDALLPAQALARPRAETRRLARALGPARDWDVFALETLPAVIARHRRRAGATAIVRAAERLRRAADRKARAAVASAHGRKLPSYLSDWLGAESWQRGMLPAQRARLRLPVATYAHVVLAAGQRRVLKRGRHFADLGAPQLHRLRIAAKGLRYAAEFFAPLYDVQRSSRYRAALVGVQDALGGYNDAITVMRLASAAARGLKGTAAGEARGIMLGWSAAMRDACARQLKLSWKAFRAARPFWE